MKTVRPYYYDDFSCIADACPYTCCREWDISVDQRTASDWRKLKMPDTEGRLLSSCVNYGRNECTLKLNNEKKCHLLNEQGLCKVVLTYGENKIPETCHVFPRSENFFSERTELALSPGCPHVLDLLWSKEKYDLLETEDKPETEKTACKEEKEEASFIIRDWFLEILDDRNENINLLLKLTFAIIRDLRETIGRDKSLFNPDFITEYKNSFNMAEVLNVLKSMQGSIRERFIEANELFLDITSRYVKQKKYMDLLGQIIPLAENMSQENYKDADENINAFSAFENLYEKQLRLLVMEEIGSSLVSECSLDSLQMKLEWIILELTVVKQAAFLKSSVEGGLSYEKFREAAAIMCRITGFSDKDIRQFMKAEFESLIWPLEYVLQVL